MPELDFQGSFELNSGYYLETKCVQKSGIYGHQMTVISWLESLVDYMKNKQTNKKNITTQCGKIIICPVHFEGNEPSEGS